MPIRGKSSILCRIHGSLAILSNFIVGLHDYEFYFVVKYIYLYYSKILLSITV